MYIYLFRISKSYLLLACLVFATANFIFGSRFVGGKVEVREAMLVFTYEICQDSHEGRTIQTVKMELQP